MFSAVGAILLANRDPDGAIVKLTQGRWWEPQPRRMWPYLVQWWSDHTESFIVVETLKKLDI